MTTTTTHNTEIEYAHFDEPFEVDMAILQQHMKWILDTDGQDDGMLMIDPRRFRRGWDGALYPRAVLAIAQAIIQNQYAFPNEECECSGEPRQFCDATVGDAMVDYSPRTHP